MDKQPNVGHAPSRNAKRDAIHFALAPAVSGNYYGMHPGTPVKLHEGRAVHAHDEEAIGIVDPFLKKSVQHNDRFWIFLYPNTVTSLRHEWTHPAFPDNPPENIIEAEGAEAIIDNKLEAEAWLKDFARKWNFDYDQMVSEATSERHGYVVAEGIDLHGREELDPGDEELFWRHIETLTDKTFDQKHKNEFVWSCSC